LKSNNLGLSCVQNKVLTSHRKKKTVFLFDWTFFLQCPEKKNSEQTHLTQLLNSEKIASFSLLAVRVCGGFSSKQPPTNCKKEKRNKSLLEQERKRERESKKTTREQKK
jgi:hypothetical protein